MCPGCPRRRRRARSRPMARWTINITVDTTGLAPGVYQATVVVKTNDPDHRESPGSGHADRPGLPAGHQRGRRLVRRSGPGQPLRCRPTVLDRRLRVRRVGLDTLDAPRHRGNDPRQALPGCPKRHEGLSVRRPERHLPGRPLVRRVPVLQEARPDLQCRAGGIDRPPVPRCRGRRRWSLRRTGSVLRVEVTDGVLDISFTGLRRRPPIVNAILVTEMPPGSPG